MQNIKILWTKGGRRNVSVVSYDRPSADDRVERLRAEKASDIETVVVKPGQVIEVEQPRTGRVVQRRYTTSK